ncbi:mechanosensitive ion channel family protein [candidate division WOR-3 bacterium]|nr:mechanosensitive ion channel family protein [candidate division WOR-3 bacterium]
MIEWFKLHGGRIVVVIILGSIIYFTLQKVIPRFIGRTVRMRMKRKPEIEIQKRSRTISNVITSTIGIMIGIVVLFTILAEVGINIGPALASLGILGLAISFGAQSLIKDLINGIFILVENQYGVGDVIRVGDIAGLVEEVNLRRTILRDLDGAVHYIPNNEINIVTNLTKEYSRVNMNVSVAYKEDLDKVIKIINRVCSNLADDKDWKDKIIKSPQVLRVNALGESGIEIKIVGDTLPLAQWDIMGELRKRIKKEFDKENIEIPFPHMKVYFANRPDSETRALKN